MAFHELPPLFKATTSGKAAIWRICVEERGDEADIIITHGFVDGKLQTKSERISSGKNEGRRNATTPIQQALAEAKSRWQKQLERKGYGRTVEESKGTRAISPMLAQVYEDHAKRVDWGTAFVQGKLDGHRCLASSVDGTVVLRSREHKIITTMPHIEAALKPLFRSNPGLTLDGELYVHKYADNFNKLASLIKRQQAGSESVQYHVYDQLSPNRFSQRYAELAGLLDRVDKQHVLPLETVAVDNEDDLLFVWQDFAAEGYEGCMLRHGIAGYEAGKRSQRLLKLKSARDEDFKIIDVREGRGTHAGMAIFQCITKAGHEFDVLSPGTHEEKRHYWQNYKDVINKKVTVEFQSYSKTDEPVPRFPRAKRVLS